MFKKYQKFDQLQKLPTKFIYDLPMKTVNNIRREVRNILKATPVPKYNVIKRQNKRH